MLARAKAKSIGETDESERFVTVEQFKKVMAVVDEKFRALWDECMDIRHGEAIRNDAEQLEKKLKVK